MNVTVVVECAGRKAALELRDYLRILWRRGWIILFVALLAAGLTYGLSERQTKIYQATTVLNVEPGRPDWGLSNVLKDLMRSYVERIRSYDMVGQALAEAQFDMSPDRFLPHLHVTSDPSIFSIQIDIRDRDPEVAMTIARHLADVFVADRLRWNQDLDKTDRIDVSVRDYPRWASVFKPKPKQNALAGLILGVLVGGLIVILLEWLESDLLRTSQAVEATVGIPVLGAIPPDSMRRRWSLSRSRSSTTMSASVPRTDP